MAVCLGVLTLVHQQLTNNDPWFDWRDFWHHEPLAACAFVAAIALMVGKYLGRNER
jgi:hypothetical protein